jgi:hypothetical protein
LGKLLLSLKLTEGRLVSKVTDDGLQFPVDADTSSSLPLSRLALTSIGSGSTFLRDMPLLHYSHPFSLFSWQYELVLVVLMMGWDGRKFWN